MKASDLMRALGKMPHHTEVFINYDGVAVNSLDCVWLSRDGKIVVSEDGEPVYEEKDRPHGAPSVDEEENWACSKDTCVGIHILLREKK